MKCQVEWITSWNQDFWRRINNLRYADDTILMAESKEELKSHLTRVKEESETACLKLNIQKMKIMASDPITLWQIDGGKVTDLIFLGSKITVDSHEIKRRLLLGRKAIVNLDSGSVLKNRDITLPTKICVVKAVVFPVVMYGCESWTTKMVEHRRIDTFKLWKFRSLEKPLDSKIKSVNPKGSQLWIFIGAEAPILWPPDVKSRFIGKEQSSFNFVAVHSDFRTQENKIWCWERLKAGGEGGDRGWDDHHGLSGHEFEQTPGDVKDREVWHAAFIGLQSQTWLSNWTATKRECI